VSYGSRGASYVDALSRSDSKVDIYIADKQRNPFNVEHVKVHKVVPDLKVDGIYDFAKEHKEKIDFCIVGPEGPIIDGVRDKLNELGIETICPTREFALEGDKGAQRSILAECCPDTNPKFKIFDPKEQSKENVKKELYGWLDELENRVAVKPVKPGFGKGVGVWGDHFKSREEVVEHFMSNFEHGPVIVEEKIDGEESSFQAFCDGKHLVPLPETRDYKRAFENDEGPNTGGMGSYKDAEEYLPFMSEKDRKKEIEIVEKLFKKLRGNGSNPGLRGIPFYVAFMHSADGPKILEINSRGGDPEIINVMPVIDEDFVEICFRMIDGNLKNIRFKKKATVVTYKVPPTYGGFNKRFPERVKNDEIDTPVDLAKTYKIVEKNPDKLRVYTGSMELRGELTYTLKSRAVACVGIGNTIKEARENSLDGIKAISGGALWNRNDIASEQHLQKSINHMKKLRA